MWQSRTLISHCDAELRFFAAAERRRTIEPSSFGNAMLLAFIVAQALDGGLTYIGIATFGASAEANPVVAWYVSVFGVAGGLALVKALAIACAATLHATERHRILAGLTALYLAAAVLPWTRLLWL